MSEQIHEFATEARLRGALVCTWHAFFARFPHLREVQKAAILPILKGESVVVNAPTASGKTEAIVAPVLERYLKNRTRQRNAAQIEAQTRIQAAQNAAKDHLCSTHTARRPAAERHQGEELMIAKGLLGEDYSYDELMKLYRRVAN